MASALKAPPGPRYGSVDQVATYAGLSPKTIRRLIEAGAIRGLKVRRRVVIPFEDLDRHLLRIEDQRPPSPEAPAMASAPTVAPRRSVDERGRALPMTADEIRRRNAAAIRALDALDDMGDEQEQRATLDALIADVDRDRPSDRRRFRCD